MSGQESDQEVEHRIAALRRNVRIALEGKAIADVAEHAGLAVEEVRALLTGAPTAADLYMLARLEQVLGVGLWPRASPQRPPARDG